MKKMMRGHVAALLGSLGLVISLGFSTAATQGTARTGQAGGNGALRDRFIGTWSLVSIEQRNAQGGVIPNAPGAADRYGYIVYDPAGYMAVSIAPVGRTKYAGAQPTDEEARAALSGYTAYFGTFTVDAGAQSVTHHLQGSLNPGMGTNQQRFFELSGNRLTLKPPPAANGNQTRLTWERMPDLTNPTAEQRKFFGFWKLVSNERRNQKGELLSSNPGQTGYIIYTRAGFMTVHMVQPNRKPYGAAQPTGEEARQNLRTYTNYFGPFHVHERDRYVVHDQVGTLNIGRIGPSPQQRFYEFSGRRLLLHPPRTFTADGYTEGTITWEQVDGTSATQ
jgi:Lipocalin-like domain